MNISRFFSDLFWDDGVKEIADTARSLSLHDKLWLAIDNRDASKGFCFLNFKCLVQFSVYGYEEIAKCLAFPRNG